MVAALILLMALQSPSETAGARVYLRTPRGVTLGWTMAQGPRTDVFRHDGTRLGHYDARTNSTYDRSGRRIAQGNVLSALVFQR